MKFIIDGKEYIYLKEIVGLTLQHVSNKVDNFVVKDINEKDMKVQSLDNDSWYELKEHYYVNLEIDYEIKPQMIYPKIDSDLRVNIDDFEYSINETLDLNFVDYYVPFGHMTRKQVSNIIGRDIEEYSNNISSYRSEHSLPYSLSNKLFNKSINEILEKLKTKTVIVVDLLGFFKDKDVEGENLVFINAKIKNKGHLIEKVTDASVKRKSNSEAKRILELKYVLNQSVSESTEKNITECYIFDDVYTKGNTINRIKELIKEHNGFITPHFHIVTYAKTVRYKTNFLTSTSLLNNDKENVLFVCNKNMTRSILAEAIARNWFEELSDNYNFYSVGIQDYAGREVCDHVYEYIVDNNLYDELLIPQRLSHYYDESYGEHEGDIIIDNDWLVVILDNEIEDLVKERYDLDESQVLLYDMPDICSYTNHNESYYENAEFLAEKLKNMIKEVFLDDE